MQQLTAHHYQLDSPSIQFDGLFDDSVFADAPPMLSIEQIADMLKLPIGLIHMYIASGDIRGVISQPGFGTFVARPSLQLFWRQLCRGYLRPSEVVEKSSDKQVQVVETRLETFKQSNIFQSAFVTVPANDSTVRDGDKPKLGKSILASELNIEHELESVDAADDSIVVLATDDVKPSRMPDFLNDPPALVNYLETTSFNRTQRVPGVKYLDVRQNKSSLVLSVSVKMNKTNKGKDLVTLPIGQPIDHSKVEAAIAVFKSFLKQYAARTPWGLINWNKEDKRKQRRVITTAAELVLFYLEHSDFASATRSKVNRIFKRYFSGKEGQIDLSTIKRRDYVKAILEMPHAARTKSDYNELIKYTSAAYNFAKDHPDVEKLNFDNPVQGLKRDRAKPKDSPELSVYVRILSKAVDLGLDDFALSLVVQEMSFCRKAITCHMPLNMLDTVNWRFKVEARVNKTRRTADHFIAPKFIPLFKARLEQLEREFGKGNKWLFPSRKIRGQHKANFDNDFNKVKSAVLAEVKLHSGSSNDFDENIAAVRSFTEHRLRALNVKLLRELKVHEAEIKNAFNHYLGDVDTAYADLSNRRQREFKDDKFSSIAERYTDYTAAIDTLTKRFQGCKGCLLA